MKICLLLPGLSWKAKGGRHHNGSVGDKRVRSGGIVAGGPISRGDFGDPRLMSHGQLRSASGGDTSNSIGGWARVSLLNSTS